MLSHIVAFVRVSGGLDFVAKGGVAMARKDIRLWAVLFAAVPVIAIVIGGAITIVG